MAPGLVDNSATQNGNSNFEELLPDDDDLLYEEELLRNPYSLRMWWRYLEARKDAAQKRRFLLYERAISALPGSYKASISAASSLWHAYLKERRAAIRGLPLNHTAVEGLNNTYERALVSMHKMPRVWIEYLELLVLQQKLTHTRHVFDRCLCSLPITQHDRIWTLYLRFVMQPDMPVETALRVYRRYLKLEPSHTEEYIAYLKSKGSWGEAAKKLAEVVDDDTFRSLEGKSKHQLWLELCDIITRHPDLVRGMKVDAILRSGIRKFTDEVGRLWTSLADYYIRRGLIEKARDVYEEGLTTVTTVRDFSLIFDTLTQFEESLISHKMAQLGNESEDETPDTEEDDGQGFLLSDDGKDIDLRIARLEHLMERRPELLSSVMLRQNPHAVHEWHKRVKLFEGNPTRQILTYTEAVKTVNADKAVGKPHTLWIAFAKFYERHGDIANARVIFDKATQVELKYMDDLATVWCEWAEMELRHKNFKQALSLMRRATQPPATLGTRQAAGAAERAGPVQGRLYRSLKLWTFYCDLEESLGTPESTRAAYDRIMELRIATPQIVLNYAAFLQELKFWEESFKVYERGLALFKWPHVRDLWQTYLAQFVQRYKGSKLERARDLFRQAIESAPAKESKQLFLQYAALEESYGLARSAMEVYDQAVRTVIDKERYEVYTLYLARATQFFGVGKVREIYETCIEAEAPYGLPDQDCKKMCLRYAKLEKGLGEIDRARAIYIHASAMADPRRDTEFWADWNAFEVAHGNEDTFREMLRIRRSVAASFSQTHFNTTIIDAATAPVTTGTVEAGAGVGEGMKRKRSDDMAALEADLAPEPQAAPSRLPGFVSAGIQNQGQPDSTAAKAKPTAMAANPEEMELDDVEEEVEPSGAKQVEDDDAAGGMTHEVQLQQKTVPAAVFGGARETEDSTDAQQQPTLGALDRFKKRKTSL
ncbi:hypothetical protein ABBQ38_012874 [Trebouxia sp. C0009 RCD-2024]